ncbi:MAG: tautomerase family protein [Pontiellaceae bacterium]|nr:tautomerase family protein [Pontiellaceae bacterium]
MPLIKLSCAQKVLPEMLGELSAAVAETIGKPEQYVMVVAQTAELMMSGSAGDAAYVEVKSIGGLNREVNGALTKKICSLLERQLGIPGARIYVTFESVERDHWGWNRSTFG